MSKVLEFEEEGAPEQTWCILVSSSKLVAVMENMNWGGGKAWI